MGLNRELLCLEEGRPHGAEAQQQQDAEKSGHKKKTWKRKGGSRKGEMWACLGLLGRARSKLKFGTRRQDKKRGWCFKGVKLCLRGKVLSEGGATIFFREEKNGPTGLSLGHPRGGGGGTGWFCVEQRRKGSRMNQK